MATLQQGENFNEAPVVDVNGNSINPDLAPAPPPPNVPKLGPKQIAIAAVALVLVIIVAVVLLGGGGGDTTSTDSTAEATTSADPLPQDTPQDNGDDLFLFDDLESTPTDSATSTPASTSDPITNPYAYLNYSEDEVTLLRGYGYTGDEIEYHSQQGTSVDTLVGDAINEINKQNESWRNSILDAASPEYQALLEKTYLGGNPTQSSCTNEQVGGYGTYRENVDYRKCGVYNYQAWIKVDTKYGELVMCMPLPRYTELADSGNMVVEYKYAVDTNNTFLYVYDIYEVEI